MELDPYQQWLGIPEGPRPPDHYTLLRLVRFEDDAQKIDAHYKKLNAHVRKYASGQYYALSQQVLNELAKAKLCLTDADRKREYDESLGRTFDQAAERRGPKSLEQVLVQQGYLTREQIADVREFAEARGLSIRDAVVQMKLLDAEAAARALAQSLGLPFIDFDELLPDDSVLDRVPRKVVKRYSIVPLFADDGVLLIACRDEPPHELEDEMRLRFEMPMRAVIASPRSINQAIAKYYAAGMRDESSAEDIAAASPSTARKRKSKPPRKRVSQLSPEEQRERRQYGILFINGSIIGSVLLDEFVLRGPLGFVNWMVFGHFLATLIVPPLVILWVFRVYWK